MTVAKTDKKALCVKADGTPNLDQTIAKMIAAQEVLELARKLLTGL